MINAKLKYLLIEEMGGREFYESLPPHLRGDILLETLKVWQDKIYKRFGGQKNYQKYWLWKNGYKGFNDYNKKNEQRRKDGFLEFCKFFSENEALKRNSTGIKCIYCNRKIACKTGKMSDGKHKNQRYRCFVCNKTFSTFSGTPYFKMSSTIGIVKFGVKLILVGYSSREARRLTINKFKKCPSHVTLQRISKKLDFIKEFDMSEIERLKEENKTIIAQYHYNYHRKGWDNGWGKKLKAGANL